MFVMRNDKLSKKIADRGREFIWNNLRMADVEQFWEKLLKKYSELLTYKTTLDKDLIRIKRKKS